MPSVGKDVLTVPWSGAQGLKPDSLALIYPQHLDCLNTAPYITFLRMSGRGGEGGVSGANALSKHFA